ncbi:SUKH-4 family immunity protein [Streptomyces sp. NPDC087440]|uniref:SUKH-4 family immunity protein n=1 Tax=Streptomyces sp. NPDC087440 TaxID=3365790 RepID=UPI00382A1CE1
MLVDFGQEPLGGILAQGGVTHATEETLPEGWPQMPEARDFLLRVGLPREAPLMRFDLDGPLPPRGGCREIGVFTFLPATHRIVLEGPSGRVYAETQGHRSLLASDLSSLVHLAELVALLDPGSGRYDRRAVDCGEATVTGMQRAMLELVGETDPVLLDVAGDISPFWRAQMVIRPLAWIAGPDEGEGEREESGLAFDLAGGFMEDTFPAYAIRRYGDGELPALLRHGPTRRFLETHGLPAEAEAVWLNEPAEPWTDSGEGYGTPPRADRMVSLGGITEDTELLLEGDTGRLYGWHADDVLIPLNGDVSALAFTQWALPQIRALDSVHHLTGADHPMAAATFTELLASVDPFGAHAPAEPPIGENIWPGLVDDVVMEAISARSTDEDGALRIPYDRPRAESVYGAEGLVTASALPPGLRHAPTRAFLTEVGLPREAPMLRFDLGLEKAEQGAYYRLGSFTYGRSDQPVLLEGDTGRVLTTDFYHRKEWRAQDLQLLASDVSTLSYLLEAVARMRPDTGPYARDRVACGAQVVEALQEEMVGVVRECDPRMLQDDVGISGFWRFQMLLRPLAWIAGPGPDGLLFDLRVELIEADLDEGFGALFVLSESGLPATLTHPATRRFLLTEGLADVDTVMVDMDSPALPTVAELYAREEDPSAVFLTDFPYDEECYPRPERAEEVIRLGVINEDGALLLDGPTGRVYARFMEDGEECPGNADISSYNFTVWMISRVRSLSAQGRLGGEHSVLVETFLDVLGTVDPEAYPHMNAETLWFYYLGDDQMVHLES